MKGQIVGYVRVSTIDQNGLCRIKKHRLILV